MESTQRTRRRTHQEWLIAVATRGRYPKMLSTPGIDSATGLLVRAVMGGEVSEPIKGEPGSLNFLQPVLRPGFERGLKEAHSRCELGFLTLRPVQCRAQPRSDGAEKAVEPPDVGVDPIESRPKDEAAFLMGSAQNQRLV